VNRTEKENLVKEVNEKFGKAKAAFFSDTSGVTVPEITEVRAALTEAGVEHEVVKNTLAKIAAQGTPIEGSVDYFSGPNAITFAYEDPVAAAKALVKAEEDIEKFDLKGGVLEGKPLDLEAIKALSKLPGREELLSMLLSVMQGPARGFVTVLSGVPRSFVTVLSAIKDKKAEAGE
jgi:large subunit ribosomal protein L10